MYRHTTTFATGRASKNLRRAAILVAGALVAIPLSGCGAAMSTYLILRAQAEVDGAEAAEAQKYAPYEYTASKEYLHKSREEQGHADFGPSIEYAFKAQELAEKGKVRAIEQRRQLEPPPGEPAEYGSEPESSSPQQIIIQQKPTSVEPEPTPDGPVEVEIVPITPAQPK